MKKWLIGILSLMCTLTSGIALSGCSFGMPQTSTNGSSASEQQSESVESSISESTEESSVEESSTENSSEEDSGETECKHKIVIDEAVSATCTTDGLTSGCHCSACGEILVYQETIAATGHTEIIDEAVEPTCTQTGLTEGKHCEKCNEVFVAQKTVPMEAHTYKTETIAPTKTEDGYDVHTCDCNKMYQDNYTDATGSLGLEYMLNADGNSYTVTGIGSCTDMELVIPKKYYNKPVTSISDSAFYQCNRFASVIIGGQYNFNRRKCFQVL